MEHFSSREYYESVQRSEQPAAGSSACFVMVRSIWLPSNDFHRATSAMAGAVALGITSSVGWRSEGLHVQVMCCMACAWLAKYVACCGARYLEDVFRGFDADTRADRSAMPLGALCIPVSIACGAGWLGVNVARSMFHL